MADLSKYYPSAKALGTQNRVQEPVPPREMPQRLCVCFRDGTRRSYPYHFISLIETVSTGEIVLHCTCNHVGRIVIKGRNLEAVGGALDREELAEIIEADRTNYEANGGPVIVSVEFVKADGG